MARILIGTRSCEIHRATLRRHEAAFILQLSEAEVRNLQRRGERLRAQGFVDEEIIREGALPVAMIGRGWGVSPSLLAKHHRVRERPLALELLGDLMEGKCRAPRALASNEAPPALLEAA